MTIRTADDAELSDSTPDPVRFKTNDHDDPTETMVSQNQAVDPALDALTYVSAPERDPLEIHGWDSIATLENLNPVQRSLWEAVPDEKVLAYIASGGRISEPEEVAQLRDGIKAALNLTTNPMVAPPTPALNKGRKEALPLCALISGMTNGKAQELIHKVSNLSPVPEPNRADTPQQRFLSTKDFTTIFINFEPPPYRFVTTLKGFIFLGLSPEQTEAEVNQIVASTLFEGGRDSEATMQIRRFLASFRDNIPNMFSSMEDSVNYLRRTVDIEHLALVKKEDIGSGQGKTHHAWNVYIHPPTRNCEGLREWRRLIRSLSFVTLSNGAGVATRTFHCAICRSENHPTGMCQFPSQEGWIKTTLQLSPALNSILNPNGTPQEGTSSGRGGRASRGGTNYGRGRPNASGRGRGQARA